MYSILGLDNTVGIPGGEVAGPVVVVPVRIGEEVPAQSGEQPRLVLRPGLALPPHRSEVVTQRAPPHLSVQSGLQPSTVTAVMTTHATWELM